MRAEPHPVGKACCGTACLLGFNLWIEIYLTDLWFRSNTLFTKTCTCIDIPCSFSGQFLCWWWCLLTNEHSFIICFHNCFRRMHYGWITTELYCVWTHSIANIIFIKIYMGSKNTRDKWLWEVCADQNYTCKKYLQCLYVLFFKIGDWFMRQYYKSI